MSKENLGGPLSPSIDLNLKIESCKKVWNNESSAAVAVAASSSADLLSYAPGKINNQGKKITEKTLLYLAASILKYL
jgi:hypothetical protein